MKKVFVQLESGRGYGRDLLKGIYEYNNTFSGWEIIFEPAYYLKSTETRDVIKMINLLKPDGCILEHIEDPGKIRQLKIPVIQGSSVEKVNSIPCIRGNYDKDGKMAVEHFSNLGFKRLGFFGIKHLEWSSGRFKSFQHYASIKEITVSEYMLQIDRKGLRHNLEDLIKWLHSLPKPIGILSCNDDFGQMLINACSMGEIKVPHEIAVLGIDNDELLCNITYPKLSSIARNHLKAAFNACAILDRMMNGEIITELNIPTEPLEVVVRNSTDTIASLDSEVKTAMQYIRNNVYQPLTVEDIVKVTNISRRSLYSRFKQITGNTIYREIQIQKLKKFKELIKNKNLSIKEAAFKLGFVDVSHVSRWFSAYEGVSPLKWRNENLL